MARRKRRGSDWTPVLVIGGLGAAAAAAWWFWQQQQNNAGALATTAPPPTGTVSVGPITFNTPGGGTSATGT